jgi:excisionase family DNA binding protein
METQLDTAQSSFWDGRPRLLSVKEAAKVLNRSSWTLYKEIKAKRLGCIRFGRRIYIGTKHLNEYIERHTVDAQEKTV